jgi:hypothetical protein
MEVSSCAHSVKFKTTLSRDEELGEAIFECNMEKRAVHWKEAGHIGPLDLVQIQESS